MFIVILVLAIIVTEKKDRDAPAGTPTRDTHLHQAPQQSMSEKLGDMAEPQMTAHDMARKDPRAQYGSFADPGNVTQKLHDQVRQENNTTLMGQLNNAIEDGMVSLYSFVKGSPSSQDSLNGPQVKSLALNNHAPALEGRQVIRSHVFDESTCAAQAAPIKDLTGDLFAGPKPAAQTLDSFFRRPSPQDTDSTISPNEPHKKTPETGRDIFKMTTWSERFLSESGRLRRVLQ